ncbi:MAG: 23S rRNA pseudouridine(1911/1915/1917) synthase RluD [Gammaproteobacteria bacterium]|nr:23S rRNA pseudouridine(1911/1915/1917) synthase RluD [Gammaproteobacteria bacterium]
MRFEREIRLDALVPPELAGSRLDVAAAELFPDYSRARLQKWIRSGELVVDGQASKPTLKVWGGESLQLAAVAHAEGEVYPQDIPLDVLHADEDLLVLNKPVGLVVHPAAGNPDGTLQNALLHFDPDLAAIPRAGIVHRLDKDTSGVMVVARSLRAHASLVRQLQSRRMSRVYRAVACGDVVSGGTVDAPIGRHPRDRKRMAVVGSGKPAVSHFRVVQRFGGVTYVEVSLESGRTHQIRVHMAHIGHPLVGDPIYGRQRCARAELSAEQYEAIRAFPRQALHAFRLKLAHPDGERSANFTAPIPQDLAELLSCLEACKEAESGEES